MTFPDKEPLWQRTPLIRSLALSAKTGCDVYLKLETVQTSGSFKGRGVSHFINQIGALKLKQLREGSSLSNLDVNSSEIAENNARGMYRASPDVAITIESSDKVLPHLVIASGGNAGLAAASAARILGFPCTVFVPTAQEGLVSTFMRENTGGNLNVRVGGINYADALTRAKAFADQLGELSIFVPAYDDPLIWQGHATLIHEIREQLPGSDKPDAVFCSVGGGGLLSGLMLGCEEVGWGDVPIVAMETNGSACFYHSLCQTRGSLSSVPEGSKVINSQIESSFHKYATKSDASPGPSEVKTVQLAEITSQATSLGASSPAPAVVAMAMSREGAVSCVTVNDSAAMDAAAQFLDDQFILTELACATTLVPAYNSRLLEKLTNKIPGKKRKLVFIVCGGSKISHGLLKEYQNSARGSDEDIWVNGKKMTDL